MTSMKITEARRAGGGHNRAGNPSKPLPRPHCTWCGHNPHGCSCAGQIQLNDKAVHDLGPCPCTHAAAVALPGAVAA